VNLGSTTNGRDTPYNGVDYKEAPFKFDVDQAFGTVPISKAIVVTFASIRDGLSSTLLLAEVRQGQESSALQGLTHFGPHTGVTTFLSPNSSSADLLSPGWCRTTDDLPCSDAATWHDVVTASRSRHHGGVQVCLADGSVRFVSNDINLTTWRNLGSSQDGEVVDLE
jgi:hypothetical protein